MTVIHFLAIGWGFLLGWLIMSMWKTWVTRHDGNSCGVYQCTRHNR